MPIYSFIKIHSKQRVGKAIGKASDAVIIAPVERVHLTLCRENDWSSVTQVTDLYGN